MKKNNFWILPLILIAASCTKAPAPTSLISSWDKDAGQDVVVERTLASSLQNQCLKDVFSVSTLKAEIQAIERKFSKSSRVRGSWRHIDLDQLPVPQANFLKEFGSKIGDLRNDSVDYNGCDSVPCIYNRIYGKGPDYIAGYVHYLWYLKMGNMLSADNSIPMEQGEVETPGVHKDKLIPLSQYLYNDVELFGLWRLTQMLNAPQTTLKKLREVQRMPRGETFEDKFKAACGLAYSLGWIKLTDSCLQVGSNQDMGFLYDAITHELSHHVDFEAGAAMSATYRSHQPDYATVAGYNLMKEYVDQWGRTTREWEKSSGIKLVTAYAGTSPQENFAESLALFRVNGELTKSKITHDHFDWISRNVYQGSSYHHEALVKRWIEGRSLDIGKQVLNAVTDCNAVKSSPKSVYFKNTDFSEFVVPTMMNCLGNAGSEIASRVKAEITVREPEGCLTLSARTSPWDESIRRSLASQFNKHLNELKKDKDYLARIESYRSQLNNKKIAQDAYVSCYGESDEETCYNTEVLRNAYQKAETLRLAPDQTQEMAEMYVSYHPFVSTKAQTMVAYQQLVASNLDAIREEAQYIWGSCTDRSHDNEATPKLGLFNVGSGYMISSFYNCLNSSIPGSIQNVVRNFSVNGNSLTSGKEEVILTQEVQPRFVKILQDFYQEGRNKEVGLAMDYMYADQGALRRKVLADYKWASNLIDTEKLKIDCKKEALKLIDLQLLFNEKRGVFENFLNDQTCAKISESPEVNSWIEQSKGELIEKVVSGLEVKMLAAASRMAQVCIDRNANIPFVGALIYKKKRIACLSEEWSGVEARVIKEVMSDPIVMKLKISSATLTSRLESKRYELQDQVIKEKFNPSYTLPKMSF